MASSTRSEQRTLTLVDQKCAHGSDFNDQESQHVLAEAARAVAYELGRQAAREQFAAMLRKTRCPA